MAKLTTKTGTKAYAKLNIWPETKERLARQAKKRGETLAQYVDNLSKI